MVFYYFELSGEKMSSKKNLVLDGILGFLQPGFSRLGSYQTIPHPLCGWAGDRFFARLQVSCKSLMVDYFK
jgi:hypothetical protein